MNQRQQQIPWFQRISNEMQTQFGQFIYDDQFKHLVEFYKTQYLFSQQWEDQVLLFYDFILGYFLKKYQDIIVIEDDQMRLEIKQYLFNNPVELQVVQQIKDQINKNKILLNYNKQILIAGFILKVPLGFVQNDTFMPYNNKLLNLYSMENNLSQQYKDNRLTVIRFLLQHFQLNYHKNQILQKNCLQYQKVDLTPYLTSVNVQENQELLIQFVNKIKDPQNIQWKDLSFQQLLQFIQDKQLLIDFISFIDQVESKKKEQIAAPINYLSTTQIQRNIYQTKNIDLQFDLRVLQFLYKQQFGLNLKIKQAKTIDDFYNVISKDIISVMQDKLKQYKQQSQIDCHHKKLLDQLYKAKTQQQLSYLDQLQTQYIIKPDDANIIQIGTDQLVYQVGMGSCNKCGEYILCFHEILQILFDNDVIPQDLYDQSVEQFMLRDMDIFKHHSFCKICGASFPLKVELQQIYEKVDPLKKYKTVKKSFQILYNSISTQYQLSISILVKDFIQLYYYILKDELTIFKQTVDYLQKKKEIVFLFVGAYLYSLASENVIVDLKLMHKYSQIKDLDLNLFTQAIQQIFDKFKIQSSFVIISQETFQLLFQNQFNKPIIGKIIQKNPQLIQKIIKENIPLYPSLYEISKYLPYFNQDIKQLNPDLIDKILEISAVDIQNNSSTVVSIYGKIKGNLGRHMERFTSKLNSDSSLYKLLKGSYIFKENPADILVSNYKQQFYTKFCYKTKKQHDVRNSCKYCSFQPDSNININNIKISDQDYIDDFFDKNQLPQVVFNKYPPIPKEPALPLDYSNKYLYSISKDLGVTYLQVVNLGGFSYLDLQKLNQLQDFNQVVEHQLKQFEQISKIKNFTKIITNQFVPKDLYFIFQLKGNYNWGLYSTRLLYIQARIMTLLLNLGENNTVFTMIKDFNGKYIKMTTQGNVQTNKFIDCQLLVSYFFRHMYPVLKQNINQNILSNQMTLMFKDDLVIRDHQGELGAFRLKTSKQTNADALYSEFLLYAKDKVTEDLDNDNDYVDGLKKNTLGDDHYDEDDENQDQTYSY